jgi:ribonuclease HI
MAEKKFYGVRSGRQPGIYTTWAECKKQVDGYGGAVFKSFPTKAAAEEYVFGLGGAKTLPVPDSVDLGNGYHIFVDGSYKKDTAQFSWAYAVYHNGALLCTGSGVGTDTEAATMRNVAGEIAAAEEAIKWAAANNIKPIIIHHDYMGIAAWATGAWQAKNKFTKAYACFTSGELSWVSFNKVQGHSGVAGNELVDKLAKEALGI